MKNKNDDAIYKLTVEDLQEVADRVLGRHLRKKEVALVGESVGDYIDWSQAIQNAINAHISE